MLQYVGELGVHVSVAVKVKLRSPICRAHLKYPKTASPPSILYSLTVVNKSTFAFAPILLCVNFMLG